MTVLIYICWKLFCSKSLFKIQILFSTFLECSDQGSAFGRPGPARQFSARTGLSPQRYSPTGLRKSSPSPARSGSGSARSSPIFPNTFFSIFLWERMKGDVLQGLTRNPGGQKSEKWPKIGKNDHFKFQKLPKFQILRKCQKKSQRHNFIFMGYFYPENRL